MSKIIDNPADKDLLNKLQELGLSPKEAAVYLALLPRQDTGTSVLIKVTGLHGQFVYSALDKLEALGLAKHVIQSGRKKFSANPPTRLLSLIEEKRLSAQSVAKELASRFAGKHEQDFQIYQGDSAFIAHQLDLLRQQPEGGTLDAVASDTETYSNTFRDYGMWDEYKKIWAEKKLKIRYLGAESQRERLQWREKNEPGFEYKILPGQKTGNMSFDVHPEQVSFVTYGEPKLCFTITNKEVADGYRAFFNAVWALAQK